MTLPYEEERSINDARLLLLSLLSCNSEYYGTKWKRIPKDLRIAALGLLRHYPPSYRIKEQWAQQADNLRARLNRL